MINNTNLIDTIINETANDGRANLIKDALNKSVNYSLTEAEYLKRKEASDERFRKAQENYNKELEVFNASEETNSRVVLEKQIKTISTKLEALGF